VGLARVRADALGGEGLRPQRHPQPLQQDSGVFAESEDQPHLVEAIDVEAIDGVLRRLGGTARRWRFDRMSTVVSPNRDPLPSARS
jgi:hypothetical protein